MCKCMQEMYPDFITFDGMRPEGNFSTPPPLRGGTIDTLLITYSNIKILDYFNRFKFSLCVDLILI